MEQAHFNSRSRRAATLPAAVRPKLDGLRRFVSEDDLVLRSRGGKTCSLRLIEGHFEHILPAGAIADGGGRRHSMS